MKYKTFVVTVTPKYQTWNCYQYRAEVLAKDRADAIKQARAEYIANQQDFGQSAATYTAKQKS